MQFQVGDQVEWRFRSYTYRGTVVAVVPEGKFPERSHLHGVPIYCQRYQFAPGGQRWHESYLVAIERGEKSELIDVYWPRVKGLRKVEG